MDFGLNDAILHGLGLIGGVQGYNNFQGTARGDASYLGARDATSMFFELATDISTMVFDLQKNLIQLNKDLMSNQASILSSKLDLINATVENALGAMAGGFEQTANRLVTSQSKKMMEMAKTNVRAQYQMEAARESMRVSKLGFENRLAGDIIGMSSAMNQLIINGAGGVVSSLLNSGLGQGLLNGAITIGAGYATENLLDRFSDLSQGWVNVAGIIASDVTRNIINNENVSGGIMNLTNAGLGLVTGLSSGLEAFFANLNIQTLELQTENAQLHLEVMKQAQEIAQKYIETAQKMAEPWIDIVDKIMQGTEKFDTEFRKMNATIGYIGKQGDDYVKGQLKMAEHMANTFGKTQEEMTAVIKSYQDAAGGRQVNMSQSAYDTQFATGRLFGMSDNEASSLYGTMNIFNTSIESAGDHMEKMYKTITKMGLSTSKFGKDLTENLKKAQKYNFRGGVENMMKLTQWAQQTRFNLESATSFSDKILGGTLSDALETSAKLQVLGGAAAIFSDPLGMLYDAGGDVGSLAKRQAGMFSDLMGTFNKKTGETDFSWYENYMIKQRANAAGMSEEDAKNMIRQQNKQGTINKVLKGYNIDNETKTAIGNRAVYNQKTGQWEVTDIKGETHNIQEYASGRRSLQDLLPENNDDAMLKIAEKSLGFEEQQTNFQKAIVMRFAQMQYNKVVEESVKNLKAEQDMYNNPNINPMIDYLIPTVNDIGRASFEQMNNILNSSQSQKILQDYFAGVRRETAGRDRDLKTLSTAMSKFATSASALEKWAMGLFPMQSIDTSVRNATEAAQNVATQNGQNAVDALNRGGMPIAANALQELIAPSLKTMTLSGDVTLQANKIVGELIGKKTDDGIGFTNGGYITNTSNVRSINDGTGITGTAKTDEFLVAKRGGVIDRIVDGLFVAVNNIGNYVAGRKSPVNGVDKGSIDVNVNVDGKVGLVDNSNGQRISDVLSSDSPEASRVASILARYLSDTIIENADGGRFNIGQYS